MVEDIILGIQKQEIEEILMQYVGSLNTPQLREEIQKKIMKCLYGRYQVICDETNNTVDDRNNNKLNIDMVIDLQYYRITMGPE